MNYAEVNQALAKEFGKGNVEVRPSKEYDYVLWFREDNPGKSAITRATKIVNRYAPTRWLFSKRQHVDR